MIAMTALQDAAGPGRPVLRPLLQYLRPHRRAFALSIGLLLAMSAAINALPWILGRAVDRWLTNPALPREVRWHGLLRDGSAFLGLAAVAFGLRWVESLLTARTGQRVVHNLRADLHRKALQLDISLFDRTPVGRLMTRLTTDVEAVQRFVTEGVVGAAADGLMLAGVLIAMLTLHLPLAAWVLGSIPPLWAVLAYVNLRLRRANREIRARHSALNSLLQEQIGGMFTIQLFNREIRARRQFEERNVALHRANLVELRWFTLYWPVLELAQAVSLAVVLAVGGVLREEADARVSLGVLAAFLAYVRELYRPISALADKAGVWQQAVVAAERLTEVLEAPVQIMDPPAPRPPLQSGGTIRFERVTFAYEPDHWVLQEVDLHISPGERVAIVGATGAGKSTLAALLVRFYDPQQGSIRLDGTDLRDWPLSELRRRIGLVPQDPFIFSGTVAENIGMSALNVTRGQIEAAARFVGADDFIGRLPHGFDTLLGERGGTLSVGEQQLIALARTVLANPTVLVVLDEATAHVDSRTEQRIQDAIRRLMRGRTTLAIAHRLSTVLDADRILVMRQGRIVADGSHESLLARDPYYRSLIELMRLGPSR